MNNLTAWLEDLSLGKYATRFAEQEIDFETLRNLTERDLETLNIPLGPRKKLLRAIADLAMPEGNAERRQLTVMFCDMVGSTTLSNRLDAEDLRDIMFAYQELCAAAMLRFNGYVARYMGDGILAYFGYPRAYEDAAERALHAAMGVIERMAALNERFAAMAGTQLRVRIGIATGPVVVGDVIGKGKAAEQTAVIGETPNLAARLQSVAQPDTVVVDDTTHKFTSGLFRYADLGQHAFKGLPGPVQIWSVSRSSPIVSRFDAIHRAPLTPLIGREQDLATLLECWHTAIAGSGRVALLRGEPGIGKSRLVQALYERIVAERHIRLRYQCSPHHINSALYPVIAQLKRAAGFSVMDAAERKRDKLTRLLAQSMAQTETAFPFIARLLGIPYAEHELSWLSTRRQKDLTLTALFQLLAGLAVRQPVFVVFEDVHWCDPTTRELLDGVVEQITNLPVLLVITFRSDDAFEPSWARYPHGALLNLERLAPRHALSMARNTPGAEALSDALLESIVAKADGVPLFIEELTTAMLEGGRTDKTTTNSVMAIPATLQDLLMARLDQRGSTKAVVQIGAAIGREFSHELLTMVAPLVESSVNDALQRLLQAGLLSRRGQPPQAKYIFKHALLQEAAYSTLLRKQRRRLHQRIAAALEKQMTGAVPLEPEVLARHYTAASDVKKAIDYWLQAGKRASEHSADTEAVNHLRHGLSLLAELPDNEQRRRLELELLIPLGTVLINTQGPGAPAVAEGYNRAVSLCEQLAPSADHFAVYWGQWRIARALDEIRRWAERLLRLAQELDEPGLLLQAHHANWATFFMLGEQQTCCDHIHCGLAYYEQGDFHDHANIYGGHDARVCGRGEAGLALWLLGHPEQARRSAAQGLEWARQLRHAGSIVHAMDYALMLHYFRRDPRAALVQAEEMDAFSREQGFTDYGARAWVFRGWALSQLGQVRQGVAAMEQGIKEQLATNTLEDQAVFLGMLAEAYALPEQAAQRRRLLDKALVAAREQDMRHWLAELHRQRGETLASGDPDEAEAELQQAMTIASEQQALSLRLRTATTLARLRRQQGRDSEAQAVLAPLYAQFEEGHDTADLSAAADLLTALR